MNTRNVVERSTEAQHVAVHRAQKNVIDSQSLRKVYRTGEVEVTALCGVDLQVTEGEMLGIMGPSGCGKTTLLNCLSGIDEPSHGRVLIDNQDIYRMRDKQRSIFRAQRMGFIFQFFNLLPVLTVIENIEMPLLVAGASPARARERAHIELERVGLSTHARKRPLELSGGQQQRVAIARALVNEPAIVWCDEPTGNLDSKTADEIMEILIGLNQANNQTFVIVTHSDEIGDACHRVIHMKDGRIAAEQFGSGGQVARNAGLAAGGSTAHNAGTNGHGAGDLNG